MATIDNLLQQLIAQIQAQQPVASKMLSDEQAAFLKPVVTGGGTSGLPAPPPGGGTNPPPTGGSGTPTPPPPNVPPGTGSGSGTGVGGNEGGASHGVGGGGAGDNAGHPGANAALTGGGGSTDLGGILKTLFGGNVDLSNYVDMPNWAQNLLSAVTTMTPFPYSLAPGALQAGLRGNQLYTSSQLAPGLSTPGNPSSGPDFGQIIASMFGLNSMGDLNNPTTTFNGPLGWPVVAGNDDPMGYSMSKTAGITPFNIGSQPALRYNNAVDLADMLNSMSQANAGQLPMFAAPPAGTPNMDPAAAPAAQPKSSGMMMPDGIHPIPKAFIGTMQAIQYGYDQNGNFIGGGTQSNGAKANFSPSALGPGTMSNPGGGTLGPNQGVGTGGLATGFGGGGY